MPFADLNAGPHAWLIDLLTICGSSAVGYLFHRILFATATRLIQRTASRVDDILVERLHRPAGLLLPVAAALLTLPAAPPSEIGTIARHGLVIALIAALGWGSIGLLNVLSDTVMDRFRIDQADNLAQRQVRTRVLVFNRIATVAVVTITLALILMTFPNVRHIGVSLFASAGVAGLVIGLAARSAIANLIAGLQVALTQPIRVDDVVIVENEWGWIEEITTTYVIVRIWDQRRLVVPLSYFIEKPFQNWTRKTADIIGTIFLHADYKVPLDALRNELTRLTKEHPKWDGKVCVLQVTNATATTVELRVLVSAANSPDAWDLRCDLREGLIVFLQTRYPECLPRLRAEVTGSEDPNPEHVWNPAPG